MVYKSLIDTKSSGPGTIPCGTSCLMCILYELIFEHLIYIYVPQIPCEVIEAVVEFIYIHILLSICLINFLHVRVSC